MNKLVERNVNIEAFGTFPALTEENVYWNGFECPLFTKEVADKVMKGVNEYGEELSMTYDETEDTYIYSEAGYNNELFPAIEIEGKKYYAIGSHSWTWTEE